MDFFTIKPDWVKQPSQGFEPFRTPIQYPGTGIKLRNITEEVQIKFTASFTNMSKADEYELLSFFNAHKGRLNAFWFPIPKNYFTATANVPASGHVIDILSAFPVWLRGYERMFMLLTTGVLCYSKIISIVDTTMTVDTALQGGEIDIRDIILFGKLICCRFDQDELSIQHITTAISECDISFIELPKEYPA